MEESFVILSSQGNMLKEKIPEIRLVYNVAVVIQSDPNFGTVGDSQWVHITGGSEKDRSDAKNYIIAFCNPELTEKISFPGFPTFVFTAFKERCKHHVERNSGIVLTVLDEGWMNLQGTNIGVTMATSKIHHMNKLQSDKDSTKFLLDALLFDQRVEELGEKTEALSELSNALKKELLEMIGKPTDRLTFERAASPPVPKPVVAAPTYSKLPPKLRPVLREKNDTAIQQEKGANSSVIEILDDTIITVSSDEEEYESDDSEPDAKKLAVDSPEDHDHNTSSEDMKYILPPSFAIKEWLKVHYQVTSDPTNYVSKRDMLEHFQSHFDIAEHPELANTFFDKLAVTIFKCDPYFRCVKTKKSKNKRSRRRLICLRRRTVSEDDKDEKRIPIPPQKATSPKPGIMVDWNANRTEPRLPVATNVKPTTSTAETAPTVRPHHQSPPLPVPVFPSQPPPPPSQSIDQWVGARSGHTQPPMTVLPPPQPMRMAMPRPANLGNQYQTVANRVSRMTNAQLLSGKRPPPNPRLRPIIIDGSNVAMSHGNGYHFSCRGIAICARVFMERGHGEITCFVPNFRKGGGGNPPSRDSELLFQLEKIGILKCTPSRRVRGQNIVCYDDRFIVELAEANNGVILSNDQYRDLMCQHPQWRPIIEQRLLQFTMVGDLLMLPNDPFGRAGPMLENFLTAQEIRRFPTPILSSPVRPQRPPVTPFDPFRQAARQPVPRPQMERDVDALVEQMLRVFPNRDKDIRRLIHEHPLENNLERFVQYFLTREYGE